LNTISRTLVAACAAAAVLVPTTTVATAAPTETVATKASAKKYTVVKKLDKAKLGVCKVSKGDKWKVYGRLDTRKVTKGKYSGTLLVLKEGSDVPVTLKQSKLTKKGKLVAVGPVVVPKTGGYSLEGGIGSENYGDGGPIKISKIRKC